MTRCSAAAAAAAIASSGMCSFLLLAPCLAFQLPVGSGVHAFAKGRLPAACTTVCAAKEDSCSRQDGERLEAVGMRNPINLSSRKEIAALVLSAMMLGGNGLPQGANAVAQPDMIRALDLPTQERLIADLEDRLMSLPGKAEIIAAVTPPSGDKAGSFVDDATDVPVPSSKDALVSQPEAPETSEVRQTPSQFKLPTFLSPSSIPKVAAKSPPTRPLVTYQERTFSISVPKFNLPQLEPVPPITLPESGFDLPESGKVQALPGSSRGSDVFRQAMKKIGEGAELLRSLTGVTPKQSDYERSVVGLQGRVRAMTEKAQNPAFGSGVPLAPEFDALFSSAKRKAFDIIVSPVVGPKVDPDFALLVLATLPVLTVALRTADSNSRQPMPSRQPPRVKKPRLVKFPNSPAKVDREAVEEARAVAAAAREAAEKKAKLEAELKAVEPGDAVKVPLNGADGAAGTSAAIGNEAVEPEISVPQAAKKAIAREILTGVGLGREVAAAVTADAESLQTELSRLKKELRVASELGSKVRALEEANLRLTAKVEELLKRPTPEEALRLAEEHVTRDVKRKEQAAKLERTRERLADVLARPLDEEDVSQPSGRGDSSARGRPSSGYDRETAAVIRAAGVTPQEFKAKLEQAGDLAVAATTKAMASAFGAAMARPSGASARAKSTVGEVDRAASLPSQVDDRATASEIAAIVSGLEADMGLAATKRAVVSAPVDAPERGGESQEAIATGGGDAGVDAPVRTPEEYENLGEGLSKALSGVRGFDLDALDLDMDDVREEDMEELRRLEKEMGNLDIASLNPEFDQADSDAFAEALLLTDAPGSIPEGLPSLSDERFAEMGGASTSPISSPSPMFPPGAGVGIAGRVNGGELSVNAGGARAADPADDWGALSPSALKRKTVAELKGFLKERGMPARGKPKKAELVERVAKLLQVA